MYINKKYKNTVQTIQNTVNTSTYITKHAHITKPTHTHTHTLQNKLQQTVQIKTNTVQDIPK